MMAHETWVFHRRWDFLATRSGPISNHRPDNPWAKGIYRPKGKFVVPGCSLTYFSVCITGCDNNEETCSTWRCTGVSVPWGSKDWEQSGVLNEHSTRVSIHDVISTENSQTRTRRNRGTPPYENRNADRWYLHIMLSMKSHSTWRVTPHVTSSPNSQMNDDVPGKFIGVGYTSQLCRSAQLM